MEKHSQKANSGGNGRAYRGGEGEEVARQEPTKALYAYDQKFKDVKSFSSGQAPDAIEKAVVEYLQAMEVEPLVHKTKFKMDLEFRNEGQKNIGV